MFVMDGYIVSWVICVLLGGCEVCIVVLIVSIFEEDW